MKTEINNEIIRSFKPCYDPAEVCEENETLTVREWIEKYRDKVRDKQDIIWLICRNDFMSDKDLRLFAVWCARSTYQYFYNIDQRAVNAVKTAEKFATGEADEKELSAARSKAWSAAKAAEESASKAVQSALESAAWSAARSAAEAAEWAAWEAAKAAEWAAEESAQIDQLLTYFK